MKSTAALARALGFCAWGCVNFQPTLAHAAPPYSEIYQRATNEFACAEYFKPAETKTSTNELSFALAPLILLQVSVAQEPPSPPDRFGTLSVSNGAPILDQSRPTIYWGSDTVQVNGRPHARFFYMWCYSPSPQATLLLQRIRITLNSDGQPVIWEVLADGSGAKVLFVSQNLETAALAEFGKPLPGRRYAIERSADTAPGVIVARVIDDGPIPMGPIVYLSAGTRQVSTLICRCMPAQARKLLATRTYDLVPFQVASTNSLVMQARVMLGERAGFWPGYDTGGKGSGACLRLPKAFSISQGAIAR
jgi:hypothetical protein